MLRVLRIQDPPIDRYGHGSGSISRRYREGSGGAGDNLGMLWGPAGCHILLLGHVRQKVLAREWKKKSNLPLVDAGIM